MEINKKLNINDEWPTTLVACGLWVQTKDSILPKLMLTSNTIDSLEKMLMTEESFRQDLANISSKDPPVTSAVGDLGNWILQHLGEVKRAKELQDEATRSSGDAHPSKILGDAEAGKLAAYNYVSSCLLDVDRYRKAITKFGESNSALEDQWKHLHDKFISNLNRLHEALQLSDVVFWEPSRRVGARRTADWLDTAAAAAQAHR